MNTFTRTPVSWLNTCIKSRVGLHGAEARVLVICRSIVCTYSSYPELLEFLISLWMRIKHAYFLSNGQAQFENDTNRSSWKLLNPIRSSHWVQGVRAVRQIFIRYSWLLFPIVIMKELPNVKNSISEMFRELNSSNFPASTFSNRRPPFETTLKRTKLPTWWENPISTRIQR